MKEEGEECDEESIRSARASNTEHNEESMMNRREYNMTHTVHLLRALV